MPRKMGHLASVGLDRLHCRSDRKGFCEASGAHYCRHRAGRDHFGSHMESEVMQLEWGLYPLTRHLASVTFGKRLFASGDVTCAPFPNSNTALNPITPGWAKVSTGEFLICS